MDLENSRIMASLTVGEFKEVIGAVLDDKVTPKEAPHEYGHGIKCIMERYGVSKTTAQGLKDNALREAVTQNGRIIRVDLTYADVLFGQRKYNKKMGTYGRAETE